MRFHKAFTLVELLVVMAIIAVLVSVLLPALSMARERAEYMVCKSNLKNYGVAVAAYLEDNSGLFPDPGKIYFSTRWDGESGTWRFWDHMPDGCLAPYLSDTREVCMCPTWLKLTYQHKATGWSPPDPDTQPYYSYPVNGYLGFVWHKRVPRAFCYGGILRETELERAPAEVVSFTEESWQGPWGLNGLLLPIIRWPIDYAPMDEIGGHHFAPNEDPLRGGVANAVFLDGHVTDVRHVPGSMDTVKLCWPQRRWRDALLYP